MAVLSWLAQLVLTVVMLFVTPVLMIPCALLQRVPAWLNTPDDPQLANQGLYEPQVLWIKEHLGQRFKTWYWLGIRNQANGLFASLAPSLVAGDLFEQAGPCPRTKQPFVAGSARCRVAAKGLWEWRAVGAWSATKCWSVGFGYKLWEAQPLPAGGAPAMFLCQVKPWLTIDSTT